MLPIFAVYILWILWFAVWFIATVGPVAGVRKLTLLEELSYRAITLFATALLFTITPFPGTDVQFRLWERGPDPVTTWRMLAVMAGALGFAWWALLHRISVLKHGGDLVTTGPYRLLRHPVYFGLVTAMLATAILFGRPSSFAGTIMFAAAFWLKVHIEESRSQSPAFAAYSARTMMFVPVLGLVQYHLRRIWPEGPRLTPALAPAFVSPAQAAGPKASPRPAPRAPIPQPAQAAYQRRVTVIPVELILDRRPSNAQP